MRRPRTNVPTKLQEELAELRQQYEDLWPIVELRMRHLVLQESIQDLDHLAHFKRCMDLQLLQDSVPEKPQCQHQMPVLQERLNSRPSYVVSLVTAAQPALVQQVLNWQAADWHEFLAAAAYRVCMMLQLAQRNSGDSSPPEYAAVVERDLHKAVDEIVTVGAVGSIYVEVTGQHLGACTALNHVTMQQEAPAQKYWQDVLAQLQLSRQQLVKLAACYQECFVRQRKAHQRLQATLADAVASSNWQPRRAVGVPTPQTRPPAAVQTRWGASRITASALELLLQHARQQWQRRGRCLSAVAMLLMLLVLCRIRPD